MDAQRLLETLQKYWGYTAFRPLQEAIIQSVCDGRDTLGLMPTGGGKSLTFQVPTLLMEGLCLVVTPLIALMKDQVDNLRARGIKATAVYSGMSREEIGIQLDYCLFGDCKFLYISPERLNTELFVVRLRQMNVCLLAIDESHCISQWGYDFRPAYLNIAAVREILPPDVPVLALTATATPETIDDIQERLRFREKNVLRKSFARPNLSYIVRESDDHHAALRTMLDRVPGSAIVYVRNRQRTQQVAEQLQAEGIAAEYFHAGLPLTVKTERQNRWKTGDCRVIVATNAFGMGIDKPDVRLVVHLDMPSSLEEYFQEAGRAGRDGRRAYAVVLCAPIEPVRLKRQLTDSFPERSFILNVYDTLGSYLQIASGFGQHTTHDFSLANFCTRHRLSQSQTYHALKLLELSGYIAYIEEPDNASRLMFLISRDELYRLADSDPLTEEIIRILLRLYTGLFSEYAFIDEALIATRAATTRDEVYTRLVLLSKSRIISYVPQKKVPQIVYTRPREEPRYVVIPRAVYEERLQRSKYRIEKVLEYLGDRQRCRSRLLLHYFGEDESDNCRVCDTCLSYTQSGLKLWELDVVRRTLCEALADGAPKPLQTLVETMPLSNEKSLQAVRYLVDNEARFTLADGEVIDAGGTTGV